MTKWLIDNDIDIGWVMGVGQKPEGCSRYWQCWQCWQCWFGRPGQSWSLRWRNLKRTWSQLENLGQWRALPIFNMDNLPTSSFSPLFQSLPSSSDQLMPSNSLPTSLPPPWWQFTTFSSCEILGTWPIICWNFCCDFTVSFIEKNWLQFHGAGQINILGAPCPWIFQSQDQREFGKHSTRTMSRKDGFRLLQNWSRYFSMSPQNLKVT